MDPPNPDPIRVDRVTLGSGALTTLLGLAGTLAPLWVVRWSFGLPEAIASSSGICAGALGFVAGVGLVLLILAVAIAVAAHAVPVAFAGLALMIGSITRAPSSADLEP